MTERQYGLVSTVVLHALLLLIMIFTFITLSKPSPSEGGILINFGDTESAFGAEEPALNNQIPAASVPPSATRLPETEDGMLTQDIEEAPVVKKPDAVKKTTEKKPEVKSAVKPVTETTAKTSEPKAPVVNKRALYSNKSSAGQSTTESGTSEGIYKGSGNMGSPTGSTESDNYTQGLGGEGIGFDLRGRSSVHLPEPAFNIQKEGIVVVEITVDRNGRVLSAAPGVKGSTLVDNTLYQAARKAALESKFNVKSDAPERQIGTISYHFKLK